MFILYAVVAGIVAGYVFGGRLERLADIRFRWAPLALLALAVQLVLFSPLVGTAPGPLGPTVYVASTALVVLVLLANLRVPGLALAAAGAVLNLAAIVANGGFMPASRAAVATFGPPDAASGSFTNSVVLDRPALEPLTDVFAMPTWLPLANVFSVGDVLIAIGIAIAIATGMRRRGRETPTD